MLDFRESAKEYIRQIYVSHREDDIESWNSLVDILFDYINLKIQEHTQLDREPIVKGE